MKEDTHSFARPDEVAVKHLNLDITVNIDRKQISGKASLTLENKTGSKELHLDTRDLEITRITTGTTEDETKFNLAAPSKEEYLGRELIIEIAPDTTVVHVYYSTHPDAAALQWLQPLQTAGGKKPYLYTQSQAILARSWVPCQDTPSVRMTYHAKVKVPTGYIAIMSAQNPTQKNPNGVYEFDMPQPIPSYLLALAVGDIEFRPTGKKTGVYSETAVVEKAAWEFAETEKMMQAVERLYGPYRWERYDLLVLPPSFPWGGMENPRLTFVAPTLLVGDRSLVATIAHELAHSWSGNLVTNATWNDFWLNEGFTSYLTHRIMEAVYGKEYSAMLDVLSFQDLKREVQDLGPSSRDTYLKGNFTGRDPEEGVSSIPYEKGNFFLRTVEQAVGRERFDAFLKEYFAHFAFRSITTEELLVYLRSHLIKDDPELESKLQIEDWVYGPGIPSNVIKVHSAAFDKVEAEARSWLDRKAARELNTRDWTTHHWMHFIRNLPANIDSTRMAELDQTFQFTQSRNSEILNEWLLQAIAKKYEPAYPAIEEFLSGTGRRKYVRALFTALAKTPEGLQFAKQIYAKTRPLYHSTTRDTADRILKWSKTAA